VIHEFLHSQSGSKPSLHEVLENEKQLSEVEIKIKRNAGKTY
jgi:hypothetical protein